MTDRKTNALTHADSYKLTKWMDGLGEEYVQTRTVLELLGMARGTFDFSVTEHNVRTALEITGLTARRNNRRGSHADPSKPDRISDLAKIVREMRSALGMPDDGVLDAICAHTRRPQQRNGV